MEHDLQINIELKQEVHTGSTLGEDLGTEQEPDLRIAIRFLPEMNEPILKTVPGSSKIEESALEHLKTRIQ